MKKAWSPPLSFCLFGRSLRGAIETPGEIVSLKHYGEITARAPQANSASASLARSQSGVCNLCAAATAKGKAHWGYW